MAGSKYEIKEFMGKIQIMTKPVSSGAIGGVHQIEVCTMYHYHAKENAAEILQALNRNEIFGELVESLRMAVFDLEHLSDETRTQGYKLTYEKAKAL